jgi:hypothetical protein
MRYIKHVVFALACAIPLSCTNGSGTVDQATESDNGDDGDHDCVFTQGYWKNHPEAWPVQELALGGRTYSQDELLAIFHTPVKGNGLVSLAHQLIAAKLNVANGGAVSINVSIEDADRLIGDLVSPPIRRGLSEAQRDQRARRQARRLQQQRHLRRWRRLRWRRWQLPGTDVR